MKRGKFLGAMLGIAGAGLLALGMSSTSATAQAYPSCAPGYYYANGYCYPYQAAPVYYPPAYYDPPVFIAPTFGIGFGFGGGFHHGFHRGFHGDGFHGGHHR